MAGQLRQRLRPVGDGLVRAGDILATLHAGNGCEARAGFRLAFYSHQAIARPEAQSKHSSDDQ